MSANQAPQNDDAQNVARPVLAQYATAIEAIGYEVEG